MVRSHRLDPTCVGCVLKLRHRTSNIEPRAIRLTHILTCSTSSSMRQVRPPSHDQLAKHESLSISGGALRSPNVFRELSKQEETHLAGPALKLLKANSSVEHSKHPGPAADQGSIVVGGTRPRLPSEYLGDLVRRPRSKLSHGDRRQVSLCWLSRYSCVPRSDSSVDDCC